MRLEGVPCNSNPRSPAETDKIPYQEEFRLPNSAKYCLWFYDGKLLKIDELRPHFRELLPLIPEKQGNGAIYGPGLMQPLVDSHHHDHG
jgi:hypothetical protein